MLVVNDPQPTATPNITNSTAINSSPVAPTVFDGLDTWILLDEDLRKRSAELHAQQGFGAWKQAGGIKADDGQFTFGEQSTVAKKIISDAIARANRFHFTDAAGVEWAVLIKGETSSHWTGLAIGCTGSVAILARNRRAEMLQRATQSA